MLTETSRKPESKCAQCIAKIMAKMSREEVDMDWRYTPVPTLSKLFITVIKITGKSRKNLKGVFGDFRTFFGAKRRFIMRKP